jgi:hypothetical protein
MEMYALAKSVYRLVLPESAAAQSGLISEPSQAAFALENYTLIEALVFLRLLRLPW